MEDINTIQRAIDHVVNLGILRRYGIMAVFSEKEIAPTDDVSQITDQYSGMSYDVPKGMKSTVFMLQLRNVATKQVIATRQLSISLKPEEQIDVDHYASILQTIYTAAMNDFFEWNEKQLVNT